MSGTAFLEEIVTWDDEKRAEKVEEALPRLILCLENYKSYDEAVGILQILCQSFVPVVQQDQLEDRVFCPVSPQICQLLDSVVEEVHEAVREDEDIDTDHLITLLQHVVNVAQCVEECVKHMTTMAGLHTDHVRSLLTSSFHVLKGSYSHCQESGGLYGDLLPALSDTLSLMFRTAHSLQMVLLNMLDKLVITQTLSDQALQDIAQACADLLAVCRIVACLDLKLTISLWKALSRLAGPQAEVLYSRMDVSGTVTYLCEEIHSGITRLLQSAPAPAPAAQESLSQGDEKVFQKSVRIVGFQTKVLVALVRDFRSYLADCTASLHSLLLCLNSILPPSISAPRLQKKHEEDLRQQLCNAAQPLLSHLLTNASFIHHVLKTTDMDPRTALARLLLCVMVMDGVAQASGDIVSMWLNASSTSSSLVEDESDPNLMLAVFSTLHMCHVEVCLPVYLPGPPCEGKPHRSVSLYQYVVEHVSAFVASCPAKYFHIIEKNLLEVLLGSNPISSQAAADCWCFLARYGTAELCWQQTQQMLSLVLHVQELAPHCATYRPLTSLLARLIKFLSPQHQTELMTTLAAVPHLGVMGEVGASVLTCVTAQEGCGSLVPVCLSALNTLALSPDPSLTQAAAVIPAMQCLHAVLQGDTGAERLTPQQGAALLDTVRSLWDAALPASSAVVVLDLRQSDSRMRHAYLSALLLLTSDFAEQLGVKLILQILLLSHKILKDSASRELTLAVLQLMQSLGRLKCPPSVEQGQILGKISDTFAAALTHPSAVVQFAALDAFTRFAEQTPHEAVVPQCLVQQEGLQDIVAAYLQKTPPTGEESFSTVSFLQHQQEQFEAGLHSQNRTLESTTLSETSEPNPKRQKVDHSKSPEQWGTVYQDTLEELEMLTLKMEKLQADGPAPDWVKARGRPLLQRLSVCLDHR